MASKRIEMKIGFMQGRLLPSENSKYIQFFPAKSWEKEIKLAEKNKIYFMEWTINYENIHENHLYNKKKNLILKKIIKNSELKINSVTCDFFMQRPFFKKKNYKVVDDLKRVINLSKNIGIKYIILPLVDNSSIENHYQEKILIKELNKLSKLLRNDQKILFEIDYPPKKLIEFLKKLNKNFGINYDTGNSAALGFDFNEEKKYFNRVFNIHIKDRLFRGKTIRLGKGDFCFKTFFNYIKKINYKGNFILQTARSKDNLKEIKKNINFVKKFI
jgi:L-ribulose-5-phosphate 3-epimerase